MCVHTQRADDPTKEVTGASRDVQRIYFMLCLLQVVPWEVVEEHQVSGEKALALHFPSNGPLMGMFC